MRERVESLGGSFQIDSAPGRGTRVLVRLPLLPALALNEIPDSAGAVPLNKDGA
jgi:chemotaxis protein histidine kinase CheA